MCNAGSDRDGQLGDLWIHRLLREHPEHHLLIEATMDHAIATGTEERHAPVGDVEAALAVIVDHYEDRGQRRASLGRPDRS